MRLFGDPEATMVIRPARPRRWLAAVAGLALMLLAGAALVRYGDGAPGGLPEADEAQILGARPHDLMLFRFAPAPGIVVAVFPSLHDQAMALNRAAVFFETAGAVRDRVPDDAAVAQAVAATRQPFDRFYYGHDYRSADLHRLWRLEDAQSLALPPAEQALRRALGLAEASPGGFGAVISLPPPGDGLQDAAGRAAILRHELSHGLYFTDPAYARAVQAFWNRALSPQQRAGFRRFLAAGFYDPTNEDLMMNEMQAYLVNTPDARFFSPENAGLTAAEAAALRATFVATMPAGWLRAREPE